MGFPQSRPVWNISANPAGTPASNDPAALQVTKLVAETIAFGVFCNLTTSNTVQEIDTGFTSVYGVMLVDNQASDYANGNYSAEDVGAVGRRGFYWVKNDVDDPVAITDATRVSFEAAKKGQLTTDVANSILIAGGIALEQVVGDVVEVYLDGSASYTT